MSGPAKMYVDYLTKEGYRPTIDSDGDVVFMHEGGTYYIDIDTGNAQYFRLVFPNFWNIESGDELARVMLAANYATMRTKAAKIYVRSDGQNTVASIELFLGKPEQFRDVFHRAMSALQASLINFREKMASL